MHLTLSKSNARGSEQLKHRKIQTCNTHHARHIDKHKSNQLAIVDCVKDISLIPLIDTKTWSWLQSSQCKVCNTFYHARHNKWKHQMPWFLSLSHLQLYFVWLRLPLQLMKLKYWPVYVNWVQRSNKVKERKKRIHLVAVRQLKRRGRSSLSRSLLSMSQESRRSKWLRSNNNRRVIKCKSCLNWINTWHSGDKCVWCERWKALAKCAQGERSDIAH